MGNFFTLEVAIRLAKKGIHLVCTDGINIQVTFNDSWEE